MDNHTAVFLDSYINDTTTYPMGAGGGGLTTIKIPSLKIQDIIRLAVLATLFAVGAPLNLAALSQLLTSRKTLSASGRRMHLLKLHLNASDLLILFVYTASQICWLITYEWRGGPVLCKLVKFLHTLSFGISSNVIVCIAFDRMASTFESRRRSSDDSNKPGLRRVKITLCVAWLLAILGALPQFFVWRTYQPFYPDKSWTQCVSIWFVREYDMKWYNRTLTADPFISKRGYAIFHVVAIFWIPCLLVAVCYLHVMAWLLFHGGGNDCCKAVTGANRDMAEDQPVDETGPRSVVGWIYDLLTRRMTHGSIDSVQMRAVTAAEELGGTYQCSQLKVATAHGGRPHKGSGGSTAPLLAPLTAGNTVAELEATAHSSRTASNATALSHDMRRVQRRAIRISVLLVAAYVVTWLPYNILALWQFIDEPHYMRYGMTVSFLQHLIVLNSVINPFLYATVGSMKKYTTNG